ncbi:TraB/GumN family protein [Lujinxingia sediminis]|uniref:TraB/GumN family protein n=1 Tax=Lujinxingia sediminis TaxID=2480984 RepID=A0ABY0CMQ1_9DELT|nr:TraB/GumN family protein [Lujinxingia sediminis]RVU40699.1 TraB/GumN family protein [Lujinxingia sediminis]
MTDLPHDLPSDDAAPHEADITRLTVDGKSITLIGTAHISQESVETVRRILSAEKPETVCVELDSERFKALTEEQNFQDLNLREVIRKGQLTFLMARLALMAFQRRMGSYTGVKPGAEMAAAIELADELGLEVELVDRNVRTTLLRAWRKTSFWRRSAVAMSLLAGVFDRNEMGEEELAELRQSHNIGAILDELGEAMPSVKTVLVDERDLFMAHHIRNAPGQTIAAVVGAAHVPGLVRRLNATDTPEEAREVDVVPPRSTFSRMLPWLVPAIVIAVFILGFFRADPGEFQNAAIAWVLANGSLSALGTLVALGHPLTIIAAFIAAPITSLNPTIGAGMVTAFVQTFVAPPKVRDLENIGDDIADWRGWWSNRLARIFLVFFLSSLGSSLGTFVAFGWLKNLV